MLDDESTLFISLSVALESLIKLIDSSPKRLELGYARAACIDAKGLMDAYLDTGDKNHLVKANAIIQGANAQMEKWKHRV